MASISAYTARARMKLERSSRRMFSVAFKRKPLTSDQLRSLLVDKSRLMSEQDTVAALLDSPRVIVCDDIARILKESRSSYRQCIDRIITKADETLDSEFRILGFPPHRFSGNVEWEKDFISGISWKRDYYLSVPLIMWNNDSDIRVPWELSRGHYLVWLAEAFKFTDETRYLSKLEELMTDWIDENPYPYGINWTCAMEAAIRMVNWVAAIEIVREDIDAEFAWIVYKQIYQHALYIADNLEAIGAGLNTNHYLVDLLGLLVAGLVFRNTDQGRKWRRFAVDELEREIMRQTLEDGFCYESSVNYQVLTTEIYLLAYVIESRVEGFSREYRDRLGDMILLMINLLKPNQTLPNFGDGDSGRILVLNGIDRPDPVRLVNSGAVLLGRPDLYNGTCTPPFDSLWLGGGAVSETAASISLSQELEPESRLYPQAGLAVMRKNDNYLFFGANPVGSGGIGGHKHNDMLTIEISCGQTDFIIDSGTYRYTSNQSDRNRFRSTEYHSVPGIRGYEQNRFMPRLLFAVRADADVNVMRWESDIEHDLIEAEHSAYTRLNDPILICRSVFYDKDVCIWLFRDSYQGSGEYEFINNLILGDVDVEMRDSSRIVLKSKLEDRSLEIFTLSEGWQAELLDHEVSPLYGTKRAASRLEFKQRTQASVNMIWAAILQSGNDATEARRRRVRTIANRLGWMATAGRSRKLKLRKTHV
jgi:hypothetical protein